MGIYFPWEVPQKALWLSGVVRWGSEDSLKRSLLLQAEAQSCWLPSGNMGNTIPSCLSKEDEPGYLFNSTLLSLVKTCSSSTDTQSHLTPLWAGGASNKTSRPRHTGSQWLCGDACGNLQSRDVGRTQMMSSPVAFSLWTCCSSLCFFPYSNLSFAFNRLLQQLDFVALNTIPFIFSQWAV